METLKQLSIRAKKINYNAKNHKDLRRLTAFQNWLGTNYTSLVTDSVEMTNRAKLFIKESKKKNKLTTDQRNEIIKIYNKGKTTQKELATKFGVSVGYVQFLLK